MIITRTLTPANMEGGSSAEMCEKTSSLKRKTRKANFKLINVNKHF